MCNIGYFILFLLFTLCVRESSTQCINNIDEDTRPTIEELSRCDQLYDLLESALVSKRVNLFTLRRAFFPQTGLPAQLLFIEYNITFYSDLIVDKGNTSLEITINWSSTSLFSVINPYVFLEFLAGFTLQFVESNLRAENVMLVLDTNGSTIYDIGATENELMETLQILTTRLEAYAVEQDRLSDWDGSGRGYIWDYTYLSGGFWLLLIGDFLLALVAIWVVYRVHQNWKVIFENFVENKDDNVTRRLFQVVVFVLILVLMVELVFVVIVTVRAFSICPTEECKEEVVITRIIGACCIFAMGLICGAIGFKRYVSSDLKKHGRGRCCRVFFSGLKGFFSHFVACFIIYVAVNVIPTVVLGFVYPLEIISAVAFLVGIAVLSYVAIYPYIYSTKDRPAFLKGVDIIFVQQITGVKKATKILSLFFARLGFWASLILFAFICTVLLVFSFNVYNRGVYPSSITSLVPPLILSVLSILAKRYIIDQYIDDSQDVNIKKCELSEDTALPVSIKTAPAQPLINNGSQPSSAGTPAQQQV